MSLISSVSNGFQATSKGLKQAKQIGQYVNAIFDVIGYASERFDDIEAQNETKPQKQKDDGNKRDSEQ